MNEAKRAKLNSRRQGMEQELEKIRRQLNRIGDIKKDARIAWEQEDSVEVKYEFLGEVRNATGKVSSYTTCNSGNFGVILKETPLGGHTDARIPYDSVISFRFVGAPDAEDSKTDKPSVEEMITIGDVYLTGTHRYSFRSGEKAKIVDTVWYAKEGMSGRACYQVRFPDGEVDYVAICDNANYALSGGG